MDAEWDVNHAVALGPKDHGVEGAGAFAEGEFAGCEAGEEFVGEGMVLAHGDCAVDECFHFSGDVAENGWAAEDDHVAFEEFFGGDYGKAYDFLIKIVGGFLAICPNVEVGVFDSVESNVDVSCCEGFFEVGANDVAISVYTVNYYAAAFHVVNLPKGKN